MNLETMFQATTVFVALWGALLSTYVFLEQRRLRRPQVAVKFSFGLLGYRNGQTSEAMVFLNAANVGDKNVTLNLPCMELPDRRSLVQPDIAADVRFPHELRPGQSCKAWVPKAELLDAVRKEGFSGIVAVRAEYRDAADRRYQSKPWKMRL